ISCATGEYELVGVFHAGYTAGSALNVVVGADELRELLTTLRRTPREHRSDALAVDRAARLELAASLGPARETLFPLGSLVASVRAGPDGALLYAVFPKEFPFSVEPLFVAEDLAPRNETDFGAPGRLWLGTARGLKAYERAALDADAQAEVAL